MARVAVVFTGGTIASVADPSAGGNVPALDGAAILARTPGIERDRRPRRRRPRQDAGEPLHVPGAARPRRRGEVGPADPTIDGAVVVQGTDTIEETSFLLDLVLDSPKPVIVTGAMRAASDEGYDGPVNLRDSVAARGLPSCASRASASSWRAPSTRRTTWHKTPHELA